MVLDGYTTNPGDNPWDAVSAQGHFTVYERTAAADILSRAKDADIILTNKTPLTAQTLAALPRLKYVSVLATGYNVVDTAAARARGIDVSNVPAYSTDAVAQHTFALLLELCNSVGRHSRSVKAGDWSRCEDFCYWNAPLFELHGMALGLLGRGRIARRVAEIAAAFNMKVQMASPSFPQGSEQENLVSLNTLFTTSDVVSLHCALTSENTGIVNAARLAQMKQGAILLNTARGSLVDESALAHALRSGHLGGAGIDVMCAEPPATDNPLLQEPACIITPHIAWAAVNARQRLMQITAENIRRFLKGKPVNVIN